MEILLRLECPGCRKCFIVDDDQVDGEVLFCPHCCEEVPVPEDEEPEDEEPEDED